MNPVPPTLIETALGGMFQDIGKFMQRAHGSVRVMPSAARNLESVVLPTDGHGGYTHKHALWTEAFFQWMETEGLSFPGSVNLHQVRNMAVFHHKPETFGALGWLAAEADRLSSGMDRKGRDEALEKNAEQPKGWDAFIKTPLLSPFCAVNLGLGEALQRWQQLAELAPDARLLPGNRADANACQQTYAGLWRGFTAEFSTLCRNNNNLALFCEGLLSLSERYTWAIPSSTVDLPDISLHDHNRTVAAIAACLHAWHEHDGTLADATAIKDRNRPKFRLLTGDLSGIQRTLFTLANQQVKGVNKILRARSFLLGMLTEAAALRCREMLGLPLFNLIQNAGGRFVLLVPNLPALEAGVQTLRVELDAWLQERYLGELALNLALSAPFAGADLMPARFSLVQADMQSRLEAAKLQPLQTGSLGVLPVFYEAELQECTACGVRPARHREHNARRCSVCEDEHRLGSRLPGAVAVTWQREKSRDGVEVSFAGGLWLCLHQVTPLITSATLSGFRLNGNGEDTSSLWPLRFVANYVPRLRADEIYQDVDDEDAARQPGDIKTFAQLAQDALERDTQGNRVGRPYLAVLKADVDRLGLLFGLGLRDQDVAKDRSTLSRYAALSRMLDLFFTGYLQKRLSECFSDTYTVYAGGDDLLLIGPWRQTMQLAKDLQEQFSRYTGSNPNITLSAGLALMKANHPLNRSVREAEDRLESAKNEGRDQICLIDEQPIGWKAFSDRLNQAETLSQWLRDKLVSTALIYKLLYFADQRLCAEGRAGNGVMEVGCANWRARWAYHLARNVKNKLPSEVEIVLNRLLGLDTNLKTQTPAVSPRIPVSIALYRNRS